MGELGGMNLYLFVANCPTRWFDILGLSEIGDALELIGDPKKFITKKLEKKLLESFPAAKAAAMAAELGKEIAEEVDSRVKNVKKKLEKSGYSLQYLACLDEELEPAGLSVASLDGTNSSHTSILWEAMLHCDCRLDETAGKNRLYGLIMMDWTAFFEGVGDGAKDFVTGKIVDKVTKKLSGKIDTNEALKNPVVKDALKYGVEQAGKTLKQAVSSKK